MASIPSSIPYRNSNGRPVSLHIGKGEYTSSFFSFEICSPVSLFTDPLADVWTSIYLHLLPPDYYKSSYLHWSIQAGNRNRRAVMIWRQRDFGMLFCAHSSPKSKHKCPYHKASTFPSIASHFWSTSQTPWWCVYIDIAFSQQCHFDGTEVMLDLRLICWCHLESFERSAAETRLSLSS